VPGNEMQRSLCRKDAADYGRFDAGKIESFHVDMGALTVALAGGNWPTQKRNHCRTGTLHHDMTAQQRQSRPVQRHSAGAQPHALFVGNLQDRKSTRLNSSHVKISYAVFCLKKKTKQADRRFITAVANVYRERVLNHTAQLLILRRFGRDGLHDFVSFLAVSVLSAYRMHGD